MTDMRERSGLQVAAVLCDFIEQRALPGTGIDSHTFWRGAAAIFARFAPENRQLLATRDRLQAQIDAWHAARAHQPLDLPQYRSFLREIGYLVDEPAPFQARTTNVDDEIARLAGPQLVVPVLNARFLLNAVNARWGSLYDALYGSDVLPRLSSERPTGYDPARGQRVVAYAKRLLDELVPLTHGQHAEVTRWQVVDGALQATLASAQTTALDPRSGARFAGYRGAPLNPAAVLLQHHGLHIELVLDRTSAVGRSDPSGLADIVLEAALTTIVDLEDSIAAVDAEDKVAAYANWLGLMQGTLAASFDKAGTAVSRTLNAERDWIGPGGKAFSLRGRALLFVRHVGHLMSSSAVLLPDGSEAPEGILDGIVTSLIALHDLRATGRTTNSRSGSVYIVKPKLHGPEETAFTDRLFSSIEDLLGLTRYTLKIGVMDEERRTSANLAACIAAVRDRVVFINTGFLDRTGDEIHTSMLAGAMIAQDADEGHRVAERLRGSQRADRTGVRTAGPCADRQGHVGSAGSHGRYDGGENRPPACRRHDGLGAQSHRGHAACAALPSRRCVRAPAGAGRGRHHAARCAADDTAATGAPPSPADIAREIDNNVQGILGYVVRWIDQGVGCSKVPDIHDINLMEDRATLRISSQHLANWLLHGVCSAEQVEDALRRMAARVDAQNAGDPLYRPMSPDPEASLAFQAAHALIFEGLRQPNGYTEPLLHEFRRRAKQRDAAVTSR